MNDRRRLLVAVAIGIAVAYVALSGLATLWTDYMWFDSVGYVDVWRTRLLAGVGLAGAGFVIVFGFIFGNLVLTDRLSPRYALLSQEDEELVERFRDWVEPRLRLVRLGIAAVFALLIGVGLAAWRDDFLLFLNSTEFGLTDPQFGNDIGFYVFQLPFVSDVLTWLFNLFILTLIVVIALHYLNGGIRLDNTNRPSMRSGVKAHISGLIAAIALLRAAAYRVDAWELLYSTSGTNGFAGAGYTDVNARIPALNLLVLVSILAAALFIWNIRRSDWTVGLVALGAWLFVSLAAGVVYPAVVDRLQVVPEPLAVEREYLERNIEATRLAYGLSEAEIRNFPASPVLTAADIEANRATIDNLRLWDPGVLRETYQNLQEIRAFYRVDRVDTDRYVIDGELTQVMISARELEETSQNIPSDWQNQRLIYTHGFGAVLSRANNVESNGQPALVVQDIPTESTVEEIQIEQPRIYFGETAQSDPLIVKTGASDQEVDYPLENTIVQNSYDGTAGVPIGNFVERMAFALRYRDLNLLISGQLRPDSRVLMVRNIRDVVGQIAPFLEIDSDPYPVIADGRIKWMMDMYTITDAYPYSQPVEFAQTARIPRISTLPTAGFNYIRNSVKAVIDAYDGSVDFYIVDGDDPIIESWEKVYPGLLSPLEAMPASVRDNIRYPQDMFKIQGEIYLDYHVTNVEDFFAGSDTWSIPVDPSTPNRIGDTLLNGDQVGANARFLDQLLPSYLLYRLPGEGQQTYALTQPFTPEDKPNMASFLIADSTPERYGRLIDFRMPSGSLVEGTGQVGARINQDAEISSQLSLWDAQGSRVLFGDMLVVPVDDSILYVQPVYLASDDNSALPEFRRVVVVFGNTIRWDDTLDGAFAQVFGEPVGDAVPDEDGGLPDLASTIEQLLSQASDRFDAANQALRIGDLAEYQRLIDEAEQLIKRALEQVEPATDAVRAVLPS
jgi:uncharacterized membrane protein (UPF0182 family)